MRRLDGLELWDDQYGSSYSNLLSIAVVAVCTWDRGINIPQTFGLWPLAFSSSTVATAEDEDVVIALDNIDATEDDEEAIEQWASTRSLRCPESEHRPEK